MAYVGKVSLKDFAPDHPFSKLAVNFGGKLPPKSKLISDKESPTPRGLESSTPPDLSDKKTP
jgi:hypothetical protein